MNNASPAGVCSSSFSPCARRGLAPNPARCNTRPLPGTALSAVLVCDFDAFDDGSLLFNSTQAGEALVKRNADEFGLLMGLALAVPAGLGVWALVVSVLIFLQQ